MLSYARNTDYSLLGDTVVELILVMRISQVILESAAQYSTASCTDTALKTLFWFYSGYKWYSILNSALIALYIISIILFHNTQNGAVITLGYTVVAPIIWLVSSLCILVLIIINICTKLFSQTCVQYAPHYQFLDDFIRYAIFANLAFSVFTAFLAFVFPNQFLRNSPRIREDKKL